MLARCLLLSIVISFINQSLWVTAMGITGTLSSDQLDSFNSQGYLVIESFANPEDIESMMKRMDKLLDDFDYTNVSVFSTKNQVSLSFLSLFFNIILQINKLWCCCFCFVSAKGYWWLLLPECWEYFFFLRRYNFIIIFSFSFWRLNFWVFDCLVNGTCPVLSFFVPF